MKKNKKSETIFSNLGKPERSKLISVLQEIQEKEGYLSKESIVKLGKHLNLPPSKIYGVATFYNQFRFKPLGKYHIQLCRGTACHVKGSKKLLENIKQILNVSPGGTTKDGLFSLEVVACIGACGLAPVISINGKFHAKVTQAKLKTIFNEYKNKENRDEA